MRAFMEFLGPNDMMAPRLVELRHALKPTGFVPPTSAHGTVPCGALYLHFDATASHYLKLLLHAVFVALISFLLVIGAPTGAHADGLPNSDRGSLHCEAAILIMSDDQFKEVDTQRTMTLNNDQKRMLRHLFKTVPDKLTIVSSTFNDNLEDASLYSVHSIWLRDRMIAITYTGNYNEPSERQFWEQATFDSVANPDRLIISSEGKIYREGRELSFPDVIRLIDELAKTKPDNAAANKTASPSQNRLMFDNAVASLSFSLPPPNQEGVDLDITPAELLKAFQVYGATENVAVFATW